ncbi:MAG: alpha/beta family hydrolase [Acidimicrobiia bacterium]
MSPAPATAVLLAPGASAGRDQRDLVAIDEALRPIPVERMDFPYRKAGRRAPDRPPVLLQAVRDEAAALAVRTALPPERLVLGGRSMGGRMCSMAVAEGLPALALVLVAYPLHPPGRPEKLRTDHFPSLRLPCLFVSGTRDTFGAPDELEAATAAIPGPVSHRWIEGGGHGLRGKEAMVAALVREFVEGVSSGPGAAARPRG